MMTERNLLADEDCAAFSGTEQVSSGAVEQWSYIGKALPIGSKADLHGLTCGLLLNCSMSEID